jgi:hypothetical protein
MPKEMSVEIAANAAAAASGDLSPIALVRGEEGEMKTVPPPQKMWVIAAKPDCNAAQWHMKYTVSFPQVLGKLAARVCPKSVGIGEAERVWKSVKKQSKRQRGKLSEDKQKKQGSIAAAYCHEKGASHHALAQRAGVLWDDADFETCKFGEYCEGDIVPLPKKPLRILCAWNERWERTQFKSSGDDVFAAAFSQKYGGLMFRDLDRDRNGQIGWTMAENCAVLQRCYKDRKRRTEIMPAKGYGWCYALLVCYYGYNTEQFYHQQPSDSYELFELTNNTDFYDMIVEYYKGNEEVNMYKKGECDEVDTKDNNRTEIL